MRKLLRTFKAVLAFVWMGFIEEFKSGWGYKLVSITSALSTILTFTGLFFTIRLPLPALSWKIWLALFAIAFAFLLLTVFVSIYHFHIKTVKELKAAHKSEKEGLETERSSLVAQLNQETNIKGEIKCVHTDFNYHVAKEDERSDSFDCYITLNLIIWNEAQKGTSIRGFGLTLISSGREFKGERTSVEDLLIEREVLTHTAWESESEKECIRLKDLGNENHIPLREGHREGWLRFVIFRLPFSEMTNYKLIKGAQIVVTVFDKSNKTYKIVASSFEPCGTIRRYSALDDLIY
ncbi:MAG TPA: hypothetical protein VGX92_05985 [Pyrinomonadaceae bacterium]|jgi:hypothetical protein|nr:hypothetical protein [Pyrinomonadaceae bacterium]